MPFKVPATLPLPGLDDEEGERLADDLPPVFDSHVHVFPPKLFEAVWKWFDVHGWPCRYKRQADDVVSFLRERGVDRCLLLHYAHKPGMARAMNAFVHDVAVRSNGFAIGTATVCPGEPDQVQIVDDAFAMGLRGIKLHCHVQATAIDDARLFPIYELCAARGQPAVVHAGREPWSPALPVDPHAICDVARTQRVLDNFPTLKLVVPHLGADEFAAYSSLLQRYDNLWLDTTMMVADFFDVENWAKYINARPERVLYGTDFPNLPYAWDREVKALARTLKDPVLEQVLSLNARALFDP